MWQHRFAIWGGILGASASCLAKMALSGDSPLHRLQKETCPLYVQSDLDDIFGAKVYKLVGDLMIQRRVNLMPHVVQARNLIQDLTVRLFIFEVDWCQVIFLGPRVLLLVCMLILNAYMIAAFMKGMQLSGSVVGAALTTASNFGMSAFWGFCLWNERFRSIWWLGFSCVLLGVLMLSSVQQQSEEPEEPKEKVLHGVASRGSQTKVPNSVAHKYGKAVDMFTVTVDTTSHSGTLRSSTETPPYGARSSDRFTPMDVKPEATPSPKTIIKPNMARIEKQRKAITSLVDRSRLDMGCPLCEDLLFDREGNAELAVADLSPSCYHVMHARCLKYRQKHNRDSSCPICERAVPMFVNATQTAHFAGFWMSRVEACLRKLGPAEGGQPQPASVIRELLAKDNTLTDKQKTFIDDDPSGLGKGLLSALEWGGSVDHNNVQKGHKGWNGCLKTKGIWAYVPKYDDVWLWDWGTVHPRQRCDQCQMFKELPVACIHCEGSSEAAFYCSDACLKRDRQRHKMTCQMWQARGPSGKRLSV
jgi:MYND finger